MKMSKYMCERCHLDCKKRNVLLKHLNRRASCPELYSQRPCVDIISDIQTKQSTDHSEKLHPCNQCDRAFTFASGLRRHRLKTHPTVTQTVATTVNTGNTNSFNNATVTTNTTNNNVTNHIHIHINPVGKEDIEHILQDSTFLTKCLMNVTAGGLPSLIERIHFDKNKPENHNIKLKRLKKPSTMVAFMDQAGEPKWIEGDMNSILGMIIENGTNILIKHNDHIFKLSSQKQDDLEIAYQRVANISKVRSKKRNVYRQVRDGVLTVAKTDRASS
jgi:hypothetical protein